MITILLVEDNPGDARLIAHALPRTRFELRHVDRLAAARETLARGGIDVMLLDLGLPDAQGAEVFDAMLRAAPSVPIVVLTGRADDTLALEAVRAGVQDYLVKDGLAPEVLIRTLRHAVERARLLADLERLRRQQIESTFLALVSHELRTPLTAVLTYLHLLQRLPSDAPPAKQRALVDKVSRSAKRLSMLIDAVLEYTRIEGGRLTTSFEPFDVAALAAYVLEAVRPEAEEKGLALRLDAAPDLAPAHSDRRLVQLILVNLVGNAVKYTEKGTVDVSVTQSADGHKLAVTDTGPGIPADRQAAIFGPFEHLEPIRRKHTPGVGLGLALVKQMADAIGAAVSLESQLGAGCTFTVTLPETPAAARVVA